MDRWLQILSIGGRDLDLPHDVHSFHNLAERPKSLAIRVSLAREIQRRLIADTYEEG